MQLDPGVAVDPGEDSGLHEVDVSPVFWGKCFVDGFLDREADEGADPPTVCRESGDTLNLLGAQHPRLDAFSRRREILKIDTEASVLVARDQRDGHVAFVADGDAEILSGGRSPPRVGQDRRSAAAEDLERSACSEAPTDPVDLPIAHQIQRIGSLLRVKLLQDLHRNRRLGVRQRHAEHNSVLDSIFVDDRERLHPARVTASPVPGHGAIDCQCIGIPPAEVGLSSHFIRTPAMLKLIILALLVTPPATAGKDVVQAEHERLVDEMETLVARQIWAGVERKYKEMQKLEIELTQEDHLHGAYAARELGDMAAVYERLKKAAQVDPTKEVIDWLWEIDSNYGHVELITVPNRSTELAIEEMPFDTSQRKAVEIAVSAANDDGTFSGLIPKGSYTFAGQPFMIEPGVSVRIEVSPRVRRQGVIEPVIIYRDTPGSSPVEP